MSGSGVFSTLRQLQVVCTCVDQAGAHFTTTAGRCVCGPTHGGGGGVETTARNHVDASADPITGGLFRTAALRR